MGMPGRIRIADPILSSRRETAQGPTVTLEGLEVPSHEPDRWNAAVIRVAAQIGPDLQIR